MTEAHSTSMRHIILSLCLLVCIAAHARHVNLEEAETIGSEFLGGSVTLPTAKVKRSATKDSSENHPYYILNADNGGFVIISSDTKAKKILGFSFTGHIDENMVPPQLEALLAGYARQINAIPNNAIDDISWSTDVTNEPDVVLETAIWGQGEPYNLRIPSDNGNNYPTGCSNTAMAILMKYYNWPPQGKGEVRYEWNGQNLYANLSESTYQWDLMRNSYIDVEYTSAEGNAVSLLMRDVAFANSTYFDRTGSGAIPSIKALVNNFSYAPKYRYYHRECMTHDAIMNAVHDDIDNGHPLIVISGYTPVGIGAHSYICDGYKGSDYLHFNFGWEGGANGFYSIDVSNSFLQGIDINFLSGIEPNSDAITEEECAILSYHTSSDFEYTAANTIKTDIFVYPGFLDRTISSGITIENKETGEKTIKEIWSAKWNDCFGGLGLPEINVAKDMPELPDGEYIIYPAFKLEGKNWEHFDHSEFFQSYVEMSVKNGVKSFRNPGIDLPLDKGKIEIDHIYYILDNEKMTATVTYKNERKRSYSGDITVPSQIEYANQVYTVDKIGRNAFDQCTLGEINLPTTIEIIEAGAFWTCEINSLNLHELINLKEIQGWGISLNDNMDELQLPPNLEILGDEGAIQSNRLRFIDIPRSVKTIAPHAFLCSNLQILKVHWTELSEIPTPYKAFDDCPIRTVVIPVGTMDLYKSVRGWDKFNLKEGDLTPGIDDAVEIDGLYYIFSPTESKATVTYYNRSIPYEVDQVDIPENVEYDGHEYKVTQIGDYAFESWIVKNWTLPETLESIGKSVIHSGRLVNDFKNLINLKSIGEYSLLGISNSDMVLPYNLETIAKGAFSNSRIQSLKIPKSVKTIGSYAFNSITTLKQVHVEWDTPENVNIESPIFDGSMENTRLTLYVHGNNMEYYHQNLPWLDFPNIERYVRVSDIKFREPYKQVIFEGKMQYDLGVDIFPENASKPSYKIESSDRRVARINNDESIMILDLGTCEIKVTSVDDPEITATCILHVVDESSNIDAINANSYSVYTVGNTIYIRGINGMPYQIHHIDGTLVYQGLLTNDPTSIATLSTGIYLVRIGGRIYKVAI